MGIFDRVSVENLITLNSKLPPLLPLVYQTKDLDCIMKCYSLDEILQDFKIQELRLYTTFSQDLFSELLQEEDMGGIILFSLDTFSECFANNWLEYHLKISKKKIIDIKIKSFK